MPAAHWSVQLALGGGGAHLVQVAQVILSASACSLTSFPEGTSNTCRL